MEAALAEDLERVSSVLSEPEMIRIYLDSDSKSVDITVRKNEVVYDTVFQQFQCTPNSLRYVLFGQEAVDPGETFDDVEAEDGARFGVSINEVRYYEHVRPVPCNVRRFGAIDSEAIGHLQGCIIAVSEVHNNWLKLHPDSLPLCTRFYHRFDIKTEGWVLHTLQNKSHSSISFTEGQPIWVEKEGAIEVRQLQL